MRVLSIVRRECRRSLVKSQWTFSQSALIRSMSSFPEHEVVGLPALSPTMETGTIAKWNKKEGDKISAGDIICEVETDKATVDYEAQDDSYLAKILKPEGSADIVVGEPIFVTVEDQSFVAAMANFSVSDSSSSSASSTLAPPKPTESEKKTSSPVESKPSHVSTKSSSQTISGRVFASPLAKKIARESGIKLVNINGSGPHGRIIREDVERALENAQHSSTEEVSISSPAEGKQAMASSSASVHFTDYPLTQESQAYAQELTQQKLDVPHYHLSVDVTLDKLLRARDQLNATRSEEEKLSVNDFIIRASALAMKKFPAANSAWMGSFIRQYNDCHINLVMSASGGVVTPVLKHTNRKGLHEVNEDINTIVKNMDNNERNNERGTFTISNVGMYDVKALSAIVSPNQSCSLGIGTIEKRVVPNDDVNATQIYKYATMMTATLACDHRVIDGATGAQWLSVFKELVEDPLKMIL